MFFGTQWAARNRKSALRGAIRNGLLVALFLIVA